MESYLVWGFIHILLFVFWLGADVGVFLSAVYAKRSDLSFETRATIMKMGLLIDFLPRICFALIFPVGLHLAASLGLYDIATWLFVAGWGVGLSWIYMVILIGQNEGKPLAEKLMLVQFALEGVLGTVYVGVGLWSLFGNGPLQEGWFAVKILLFGCVFYAAMAIDICFRPFIKPFMDLAEHGSTPEREAIITKTINKTLVAVLTMYALIGTVAFLGKVKPF